VKSIYKYYHCSAKRLATLRKIQEVFDLAHRKFKDVFDVQCNRCHLVQLGASNSCLESGQRTTRECYGTGSTEICSHIQFLATVHIMSDVLGHVNMLSRLFQTKNIDFFQANLCFDACLAVLTEMKCKPGPILQQFLNILPQTEAELPPNASSFMWNGIEIQFNRRDGIDGFNQMMEKFLQQLCNNLETRFPDADA